MFSNRTRRAYFLEIFRTIFLGISLFLGLCLIAFFPYFSTNAAQTPYAAVGQASTKKMVVAFPTIITQSPLSLSVARNLTETITNDLTFMDFFSFLNPSAFIENAAQSNIALGSFKFSDWTSIGAELLIKSTANVDAQTLTYEVRVYDTQNAKQILAKRYTAPLREQKTLAHTFANDFVQTITGFPGIFLTKFAMSCDMSGKKEIYLMNFDGSQVKQLTQHHSIAFAPSWSPDGTRLTYSLFTRHEKNVKNIDLYEMNLNDNTARVVSNRRGINSGAAYSPDGSLLAATLSFGGNPEIYTLDTKTHAHSKITHSFGFDVDPAWSPDGKKMAFVSSRTGMPMIFSMNANGSNIQRLTYAGKFNASPSWSPRGDKITFAGWIDKSFDIFIMNADGTHIERLTKNQGGNEDPYFSPDGNFIAFSSNRTGQKNIYVMNVNGTFVKRLTYGLGNCVAPKWSNPPVPRISNTQR